MSLTSDQLNYMIWRYLQESGFELTTYALQKESKAHESDKELGNLIPQGYLVNLVQRGILYSQCEHLVDDQENLDNAITNSNSHTNLNLNGNDNDKINNNDYDYDYNFGGKYKIPNPLTIFGALESENENLENGKIDNDHINNNSNINQNNNNNTNIEKDSSNINNNNGIINDNMRRNGNVVNDLTSTSTQTQTLPTPITIQNQYQNININGNGSNKIIIQQLSLIYKFKPSETCQWNPSNSNILAWGEKVSFACIKSINSTTTKTIEEEKDNKIQIPTTTTNPQDDSVIPLRHSISPGDNKSITVISWSPNGKLLATADESGELRIWTIDGKLRNIISLQHAPIFVIRWNNENNYLVSIDCLGTIIVIDSITGDPLHHEDSLSINKILQINDEDTIMNDININTDNNLNSLIDSSLDAVWLDSNTYTVSLKGGIILFCQVGETSPIGILKGHTNGINSLAVDSSKKLLASGSQDTTIRIWQSGSNKSKCILYGHTSPIIFVKWIISIENVSLILSTSLDGTIRIWNYLSSNVLSITKSSSSLKDSIYAADISPDGKWLAVGGITGIITIWKVFGLSVNDKMIPLNQYGSFTPDGISNNNNFSVSCISWSSDSKMISVSYSNRDSVVLKWDDVNVN